MKKNMMDRFRSRNHARVPCRSRILMIVIWMWTWIWVVLTSVGLTWGISVSTLATVLQKALLKVSLTMASPQKERGHPVVLDHLPVHVRPQLFLIRMRN